MKKEIIADVESPRHEARGWRFLEGGELAEIHDGDARLRRRLVGDIYKGRVWQYSSGNAGGVCGRRPGLKTHFSMRAIFWWINPI